MLYFVSRVNNDSITYICKLCIYMEIYLLFRSVLFCMSDIFPYLYIYVCIYEVKNRLLKILFQNMYAASNKLSSKTHHCCSCHDLFEQTDIHFSVTMLKSMTKFLLYFILFPCQRTKTRNRVRSAVLVIRTITRYCSPVFVSNMQPCHLLLYITDNFKVQLHVFKGYIIA